jgi:hypothetical protein
MYIGSIKNFYRRYVIMYIIEVRVKREVLRRAAEFIKALQLSYSRNKGNKTGIHVVISGGKIGVRMKLSDYEKGQEIASVNISDDIDIYVDNHSKPRGLVFHAVELSDTDVEFLLGLGEGFDDVRIILEYNNGEEKVLIKDRKITFEV